MYWLHRLHRFASALLALAIVAVALVAPDFTWSAAPTMGTASVSSKSLVEEEDAPPDGDSENELEDEVNLAAEVQQALTPRHSIAAAPPRDVIGAATTEYTRLLTPPPES